MKVYESYGSWKERVRLAWVAQNSTRICEDDCWGHGVCVEGGCHCDKGWAGNGTCDTCEAGYWGADCQECVGFNDTSTDPLSGVSPSLEARERAPLRWLSLWECCA
jgi:hypothetical protein